MNKQPYSLLIKGNGPAGNGADTDADIALVKLFNDLKGAGHEIEAASVIVGGVALPLAGSLTAHEVPEGVLSKPIEEVPAELKKLDKKELTAAVLALRAELDALKANVGKAIEEAETPGTQEVNPPDAAE